MDKALSGMRVVECCDGLGAYAGKLLADLGAEVIKVEPPGGCRERHMPPMVQDRDGRSHSLFFAFMGSNKRSVCIDNSKAADIVLLERLVARADVLLENPPHGVAAGKSHPGLIRVTLTAFGHSGAHAHWQGSDLVAWASSGALATNGDPDRSPVMPAGLLMLAETMASINAAAGALLAWRARRLFGMGQHVEISVQEAALAVSCEVGLPLILDDLMVWPRQGNRRPMVRPFGLYPTQDGWASIVVIQPQHWQAWAAWLKERCQIEEASDPQYQELMGRIMNLDLMDRWTEQLSCSYTKQALFEEGQRRGVPITPVNTIEDILGDRHLAQRGFWATLAHPMLGDLRLPGMPYRLSATPGEVGLAPELDADHDALAEILTSNAISG